MALKIQKQNGQEVLIGVIDDTYERFFRAFSLDRVDILRPFVSCNSLTARLLIACHVKTQVSQFALQVKLSNLSR